MQANKYPLDRRLYEVMVTGELIEGDDLKTLAKDAQMALSHFNSTIMENQFLKERNYNLQLELYDLTHSDAPEPEKASWLKNLIDLFRARVWS